MNQGEQISINNIIYSQHLNRYNFSRQKQQSHEASQRTQNVTTHEMAAQIPLLDL